MTGAAKIPLAHPLKTLKLPTFLREYEKLARLAAAAARLVVCALSRANAPPKGWIMSSSWRVWSRSG